MRKATVMCTLSAFVLGTVLLTGCGAQSTLDQGANVVSVQVSKATDGWLGSGPVYTGTVQPQQEVKVLPKISGKIASFPVTLGTRVKVGQTLFTLDDRDLRTAVERAQAAVDAAQAQVQVAETQQQSAVNQAAGGAVSAKSGVIQAQNAVAQALSTVNAAQNAVVVAKQALDDAAANKQRYEQLYQANVIPKIQLEQAETAYVKAQADYSNAQKNLQAAQAGLANARQGLGNASQGYATAQQQIQVAQSIAGVEASQQALQQALVNLKAAQDTLSDATVTSPIDGIVGVKNAEIGDMVGPQMTQPVVVVANLDTVKILVYMPATAINTLKVGDPVMVKAMPLDTYFKGQVSHISPLDQQGKGYPVEISVPNKDLQLKAGMVAEVHLLGPDAKRGIIVPASALWQEDGKNYVYVAVNNIARRQEVTVVQRNGSQVLLSAGVRDGDAVIINQLPLLKDQTPIYIEAKQ